MDTVSNPNDFNFTLSSHKKGEAGKHNIRSLMEGLFKTLKREHKTETPQQIESHGSMNYYLFGVIGQGFDEALKEARDNLIKKLNHAQIFQIFLKEGLKNNLLGELFKDIESQLKEGNKVINSDSTIVVKTLNKKDVIIHVDSSPENKEKISIVYLPLSSLHGKGSPAEESKESKVKHIVRDFAAKIIKVLRDNYHIKVPIGLLKTLDQINYYLFGVAYDRDLKILHQALIQEVNKKDIFDLLLEEGLKNKILRDKFANIKIEWEKEGGEITEDSFIMIEKLNKNDVIIKTNALKNKAILPIEDEKQLLQNEDNKSSFDSDLGITSSPPHYGFNDPSKESVVPNMRPTDLDSDLEGIPGLFEQQYNENPHSQLHADIPHPQQQQEETQNDQISPHGDTEEAEKKELVERLEESKNLINELSDLEMPPDDGFNDPSKESVVANMRPRDFGLDFEAHLNITSSPPHYGFNDPSKESVVPNMRPTDLYSDLEGIPGLFEQQYNENPHSQLHADIPHPQQQQEETQNDQISPHGDTEEAEKKELVERLEESKNLIYEPSELDMESVVSNTRPTNLSSDFKRLLQSIQPQALNDDSRDENPRSQLDPDISHPQQQQEETQNDQISLQEAVFEERKNMIDDYKKQLEIAKQEAAKNYSQLEHTLATQKAEFEKQIKDMETKQKEAMNAVQKENEEKIRKLNEEKKALKDQFAQAAKEREQDRTSEAEMRNTLNEREQVANKKRAIEEAEKKELMERLKKISQLNEALETENQNLKVDIRENSAKKTELINYARKLKQTVSERDEEIIRLKSKFQAKISPRMLTYNSRPIGRCWGCGGGPGHNWSFSCDGDY